MTCKPRNSWVGGKVKCGSCGYGLTIAKANTKWHRYFICSTALATKKAECTGTGGTVYADVLEEYMRKAIRQRLAEFHTLSRQEEHQENPKINSNKIRLAEIDKEIEALLPKVAGATPVLMEYINQKAEALDAERKQLQKETLSMARQPDSSSRNIISDHVQKWEEIAFEDKQAGVDVLIKVITIGDNKIAITWNI